MSSSRPKPAKRGALIGCGYFARNHMNAWAQLAGAEIVAVCDRDGDKARAMAASFDIAHVFTDADEMLSRVPVDFVDVVTTSQTHRELVELACRHGRHVICQKPFADRYDDAAAMVEAARSADVHLIVHENFRWQNGFVAMKALLDAGAIGTPHFARFSFRHGYDNYKNQPYLAEIERFVIMDVGLHLYDLARHFLGDVAALACHTQRLNASVRGEDAFTALLRHDQGAVSVIDASFQSQIAPDPFPHTVAWLEGDRATLELTADFRLFEHRDGDRIAHDVRPPMPAWSNAQGLVIQDSVVRFQDHVIDVLNGRAMPQPSGADNLFTLKLALASYEAASTGQTITMADWKESRTP